jgi:hypothetical protein
LMIFIICTTTTFKSCSGDRLAKLISCTTSSAQSNKQYVSRVSVASSNQFVSHHVPSSLHHMDISRLATQPTKLNLFTKTPCEANICPVNMSRKTQFCLAICSSNPILAIKTPFHWTPTTNASSQTELPHVCQSWSINLKHVTNQALAVHTPANHPCTTIVCASPPNWIPSIDTPSLTKISLATHRKSNYACLHPRPCVIRLATGSSTNWN